MTDNKAITPELIMEELARLTGMIQNFIGEKVDEAKHAETADKAEVADKAELADKAKALETPRTLTTDFTKTGGVSFDGSANVNIGTSGTLPISKGGTGSTSYSSNGLLSYNSSSQKIEPIGASVNSGAYYKTSGGTPQVGILPVAQGGTGTSSFSNYSLLGYNATSDTLFSIGNSGSGAFYKTSSTSNPTIGTLPVAQGGTGATNAAQARTNLGLGALATQDTISNPFGTSTYGTTNRPIFINSGTPSGISSLSVAYGGTGKTSWTTGGVLYASATGTLAQSGTGSGAMYRTTTTGAPSFGTLPVAQGGTGATTAANARSNLGLGTIATINLP